MQSSVIKTGFILLLAAALAGCGGSSSSKTNNIVAQVTLAPASISLVAGEVSQVSAGALNSAGTSVTTTFTFNSSNTSLVTVAPSGSVCGGVWDSTFVVCKGAVSPGSATITASAQGVSSAPVQVSVHPPVTSIVVDPVVPAGACFSIKQTHTFTAKAFNNATDITSLVGPFNWLLSTGGVGSIDANGVVTATTPGLTGVIANVGTVSSPAAFFKTCLPVEIRLHLNGDPAGMPTTSATLNVTDTKTVQADMLDENNVTTASAPVSILSNNPLVASVSSLTLTGQSPGGAGLLAVCAPPTCGIGLNTPIYSNLFRVTVNGTSPVTTVYATTSFAPPSGTFSTLVPIDTSKTPPVAGTAINLPGPPNSMVFTRSGAKAFLGTTAGLASLDTATNVVTLVDPTIGKVLAISPDGSIVILSNAANAPDPLTGIIGPIESRPDHQRLVIFAGQTVTSFVLPGATEAAFDNDSFRAYIAVNNGNVYVFSPFLSVQTLSLGGVNSDVASLASGPFTYLVNGPSLQVLGTCNNTLQGTNPPATSPPQLVGSIANTNIIVAVNSTGLDIATATVTPLTPPVSITTANCTPNVSYTNQFIDFGLGAFIARQLLVPTDGIGASGDPANGTHIVVLPVGINKLLTAVPGSVAPTVINLAAGGTEALSGGMTLDGNTAWVGVAGSNTVDKIDLAGGSDTNQVAMSFKKSDSTPAPPNIVGVKPK